MFKKHLGQSPNNQLVDIGSVFLDMIEAWVQVGSAISAHKDLSTILELIARQSLRCLKAHRSTIYLAQGKNGILKTQYTCSADSLYEKVSLFEEKEVARKALKERKSFLLRTPEDFSNFFKYWEREQKVTSLIGVPLYSQNQPVGALSVVLVDEDPSFDEKDLEFISIFGHQASVAIENVCLAQELRKEIDCQQNYRQYLDDILHQLQNFYEEEHLRIATHIEKLLPASKANENESTKHQGGDLISEKGPSVHCQQGYKAGQALLAGLEGTWVISVDDLGPGRFIIQTPNPMDLEEQFPVKFHISEKGKPIKMLCKVIWTNKYGKESECYPRGMGVKFLNLTPEVQEQLEEFLRSNKDQEFSFQEGEIFLKDG